MIKLPQTRALLTPMLLLLCLSNSGCAVHHTYTAHLEHTANSPVVTFFIDGQYASTHRYRAGEENTTLRADLDRWAMSGALPE